MKELYNEFFYIPNHKKISEKAMLTRVVMAIIIVIMCVVAMSITAYAYFSCNITSGSNTIKAASFDAQITVTSTDQNAEIINPSSTDGNKTVFTFTSPGTYTVKLEKGNCTAKTGFCIVYIGNDKYHTQQIGVDINANNEKRELVSFDLKINEQNTVVTIESHWGTSSYYNFDINENNTFYIMNDPRREIEIGNAVNGASDLNGENETSSTENTQPADTTSETQEPSEPTTTTEPTTPTSTEPAITEPVATESTSTTESIETQPSTENAETTGTPTTEANE